MMNAPAIMPKSIHSIIKGLEETSKIDNQLLRELVLASGVTEGDLTPFTQYDHDPALSYGRQCLWSSRHAGIYVMSWNQGDGTAIHDHGHAEWGLVSFFGDASHRVYKAQGNMVHLASKTIVAAGTLIPIHSGEFCHAMGNPGSRPFITLHIYGSCTHPGPATEDARVFEVEKGLIRTSTGPAFINISEEYVKTTEQGIFTDPVTKADYLEYIAPFYERR